MAAISMKNIVKKYGDGFLAVNDVSLDVADGRVRDPRRPVGVREVDAAADDRRPGGHHVRRHAHRRRARQRQGAARPQPGDGLPELRALPAPHVFENIAFPLRLREGHVRGGDQGARSRRRRRRSSSPSTSTASRPTSPAASASGSRWVGPSCATRTRSCSTSRCRTSTPSCAARCAPRSCACSAGWARPRSTSPTTRPRR